MAENKECRNEEFEHQNVYLKNCLTKLQSKVKDLEEQNNHLVTQLKNVCSGNDDSLICDNQSTLLGSHSNINHSKLHKCSSELINQHVEDLMSRKTLTIENK